MVAPKLKRPQRLRSAAELDTGNLDGLNALALKVAIPLAMLTSAASLAVAFLYQFDGVTVVAILGPFITGLVALWSQRRGSSRMVPVLVVATITGGLALPFGDVAQVLVLGGLVPLLMVAAVALGTRSELVVAIPIMVAVKLSEYVWLALLPGGTERMASASVVELGIVTFAVAVVYLVKQSLIASRSEYQRFFEDVQAELVAVLEAFPDLVVRISDGRIIQWWGGSSHGTPLLGPSDRSPGLPLEAGISAEAAERVRDAVGEALRTRSVAVTEFEVPDAGETRIRETWIVPIGDTQDVICVERDVTELRKARQDLERYAAELERSNRDFEEFAYTASHDLKEPLRKVATFGDMLDTGFGDVLGDDGRDYLTRMTGAAERMGELLDGLLAYSRVSTHRGAFEPTDLSGIIVGVVDDLEVLIGQHGALVEVGELPRIDADPVQMRQLFQNLIQNALKFQRPDTPPRVQITARVGEGITEIDVADNGIGFDDEHRERMFRLFERLHGRGEYPGSGLGLAICRKIAVRHGGDISAHGVPGEGSTFTVTLPLHHSE